MEHLTEGEARRFALAASRALGEIMPQDFHGQLLRDVTDRGVRLDETASARYSDTRQGGNLHTDGSHHPGRVPDVVSLYCMRQAWRGGALALVHLDDLLAELARTPDVLATLRQPVHLDTRDPTPQGVPWTVRRPVLEATGCGERIYYLRDYIESGHRQDGVPPLSTKQTAALDVLDALLERTDLQMRGRLNAGEMIFLNNRSIAHGRTSFQDAPTGNARRLLLRVWIAVSRWPAFAPRKP